MTDRDFIGNDMVSGEVDPSTKMITKLIIEGGAELGWALGGHRGELAAHR